ncbi:MAG: chemotaxis protein CheX [Sedimentisphaerales bacterium]|nr:chemotaxis protein CheX [Sedimentisphaerales bacterium]
MTQVSTDVMIEALNQALETMMFMMALPAAEELPVPAESVLVTMGLSGAVNGKVRLLAGKDLLGAMAANALGVDPDDSEAGAKRIDGFGELLNMTCGLLLPQLADMTTHVCDLTIPEAQEFTSPEQWHDAVAQFDMTIWDVEGRPLAVGCAVKK